MGDIQRSQDFAKTFEVAFARLTAAVEEACARGRDWPNGVAAAIDAALCFAATQPAAARVLTVDVFQHGFAGVVLYRRLVDHFAPRLAAGRAEHIAAADLPPITEEVLIGAIIESIAAHLITEDEASLPALAPELAALVGVFYADEEAGANPATR